MIDRAARTPRAPGLFLPAVILISSLALGGCGRLAEQIDAADTGTPQPPAVGTLPPAEGTPTPLPSAPASSPTTAPAVPDPTPGTEVPSPEESPQLSLTQNQQGLPAEVKQACRLLLAAAVPDRLAPKEAGSCVGAAMRAGSGAVQVLTTRASGLPAGEHTADLNTAPEFGLALRNEEHGVQIIVSGGRGYLLTRHGGVAADPEGGPEERFAAVLVEAASATADPAALGALLAGSGEFLVTPGAERGGMLYTRISAVSGPELQGVRMTTFELWLDELFRPAHISLSGSENEIATSVNAAFSQWGSPRTITPPALADLRGLR